MAGAGHGELVAQLVVPQLLAWALASVADPAGQAAHQPASRQLAALAALSDLATATGATRLPVLQALCDRYQLCKCAWQLVARLCVVPLLAPSCCHGSAGMR